MNNFYKEIVVSSLWKTPHDGGADEKSVMTGGNYKYVVAQRERKAKRERVLKREQKGQKEHKTPKGTYRVA